MSKVRITSDGRVIGELFEGERARVERLAQAFFVLQGTEQQESSYARPDRFAGGAKVGPIQHDPGYARHVELEVTTDPPGVRLRSSRPYLPDMAESWLRMVDQLIEEWICAG